MHLATLYRGSTTFVYWGFASNKNRNHKKTTSFRRDSEKSFTQIYRALYGDAMLVPFGGAPTCKTKETSVIEFCY